MDDLLGVTSVSGRLVIAALAGLELRSVLTRLAKSGAITSQDLQRIFSLIEEDISRFSAVMPMDDSLLEEAGRYLDEYPLRTLDALHFAAIKRMSVIAKRAEEPLVVVGSDKELLEASRLKV